VTVNIYKILQNIFISNKLYSYERSIQRILKNCITIYTKTKQHNIILIIIIRNVS